MAKKLTVLFVILAAGTLSWSQAPTRELARLLKQKGLISQSDLERMEQMDSERSINFLTALLQEKGVITQAELSKLQHGEEAAPPGDASAAAQDLQPPTPQTQTTPQTQPATAQPAKAEPPVAVYGTLLLNAFANTAATNNIDIPLYANSRAPGSVQNFGMTARQTRFGVHFRGPQVAGARLSGTLETDFFGGKAALPNGISMDLLRLRLAFGRLDWENFSLEAGQDWAIFAPLNPTSYAHFAIPALSGSGNPWIRTPQIRTEWTRDLGGGKSFVWQFAALDPNIGDYPVAFATLRQPESGELGRSPAIETYLSIHTAFGDRKGEVGLSGHWNPAKNVATVSNQLLERNLQSWGVAFSYNLPFSKIFGLSGEVVGGRALGIFTDDLGQSLLLPGTPGEHGVGTRGGWMQAQINFTDRWQANGAYGIEVPIANNLITGNRSKNQTYTANVLYKLSPRVTFAWEWNLIQTNYLHRRDLNNRNHFANMAVAYTY